MDQVISIAAILALTPFAADAPLAAAHQSVILQVAASRPQPGVSVTWLSTPAEHVVSAPPAEHVVSAPSAAVAVALPGEDKFRHVALSWTTTAFAYAAARALDQGSDDALTIALPITAAVGLGKEIVDARGASGFSARDLLADAVGAAAAWLFLREVR